MCHQKLFMLEICKLKWGNSAERLVDNENAYLACINNLNIYGAAIMNDLK